MGSKTTNSGSTSVNLPLHFFYTDKQDAEILKLNLGQQLVPFLVVNHGLRFGGADSSFCFWLSPVFERFMVTAFKKRAFSEAALDFLHMPNRNRQNRRGTDENRCS